MLNPTRHQKHITGAHGTGSSVMSLWRMKNKKKAKEYNKKYYDDHRSEMIEKAAEWNRNNAKHHSWLNFKSHLKRIGWTWEEYIEARKEQKNLCAICHLPNNQAGRPLHADHSHKTGKKRRLLCSACNTGLGSFDDNPNLLKKAIEYLRRNGR
jgi:hypothetical protein